MNYGAQTFQQPDNSGPSKIQMNLKYTKQSLSNCSIGDRIAYLNQIPMYCPFLECRKDFKHSGNLKTHMRSHVSYFHAK